VEGAGGADRTADKAEWRAWALERRGSLPDVSDAVTAHLRVWLRARNASTVLAYRALPGEVRVDDLAGEFELLTTRTRWRPTPRLTVHPWASATERGRSGLLQPPADAPVVPVERVDAVLVPGLAFDTRGGRLGFGGGFYDRLLADLKVARVGVTPAALVVLALPLEPHDALVEFLATQDGVRAVPGGGAGPLPLH
jgi:5-formyltetrahydrofolate cyclo-ligase